MEVEEQVVEDTKVENKSTPEGTKPPGYDPVDPRTATPEENEARIKYIYAQLKDSKKENKGLRSELAELKKNQENIQNSIQMDSTDREIQNLEVLRKEARAAGDDDRVDKISDQIAELRFEKRLAKNKPNDTTKPQQEPFEDYDPERARAMDYIDDWSREVGTNGQFVRPWGVPGHPDFQKAVRTLHKITSDPSLVDYSLNDKLKMVEREMNGTKAGGAIPGRSQLNGSRGGTGHGLTAKQMEMADKLLRGPKYKTPEERYKRYAEIDKKQKASA